MAEPTKQELQALAWALASWARCLPPMGKDRHQNPSVAAMHDKVRAARAGLAKLRAASGVKASGCTYPHCSGDKPEDGGCCGGATPCRSHGLIACVECAFGVKEDGNG